jgi:DNA polymerase-3 subunit delta'
VSGWDGLVGAERPRAAIERSAARKGIAHAYLFVGPDGVGKRAGALLFAAALLCDRDAPSPCGRCDACRDAEALRHEDLLLLHAASNPFWHEPARLAKIASLPATDLSGLAALLERLGALDLIGRPVPGRDEKRHAWPIALSPEGWLAKEGARPREDDTVAGRIARLAESGKLSKAEARLARHVALPPLSVALYRRGPRGLGIGAIAPREGQRDRSLKSFLEKRPSRGRRKIAIVDEAHWMTEEAQNALLKTLEEPPDGVVLVLVTANSGALLPTILSRVQRVPWRALEPAEMAAYLADATGYDDADRALIAGVSGGSPGRALREEPSALRDLRAAALGLLRAGADGDLRAVLAVVPRLAGARAGGRDEERERLLRALDLMLLYVRDLRARALLGAGAPLASPDLADEIAADILRWRPRAVAAAARRVLEARARLLGFCDPRLVVEALAFSLFPEESAAIRSAVLR